MVMTTMPLAEVKARLSELVGRVAEQHERITVTVHGRPSAVLMAVDDLDALHETLSVLADPDTLRRLAESDASSRAAKRSEPMSSPQRWPRGVAPRERTLDPTVRTAPHAHGPASTDRLPSRGRRIRGPRFINGPLLDNPHRIGKRLLAATGSAQCRRGSYRVIYRIDDERGRSRSSTSTIGARSTDRTDRSVDQELRPRSANWMATSMIMSPGRRPARPRPAAQDLVAGTL
jgi:prevent-host-death family protein